MRSLHRILGGRISVLPPDCRHVDYDVIPLVLAEGCLYNCCFCRIKTGQDFLPRTRLEIGRQLQELREYFGPDLCNFNSLFLGQHDALAVRDEDILLAAEQAYDIFCFEQSHLASPRLFFFGSVDSLLDKKEDFFVNLQKLPYLTSLNIGLESFDQETLAALGKPLLADRVGEAFLRVNDFNQRFPKLEISVNFILGDNLPQGHGTMLRQRLQARPGDLCGRTTVYLSPLFGNQSHRMLVEEFRAIKRQSRLDTYLYLIQRL